MSVEKRTVMDDDGSIRHVLDYESVPDVRFDLVVLKHDPDDEDLIHVVAWVGEEKEYQNSFKRRQLSFDPISVIGRGESGSLEGVSEHGNPNEVPDDVATSLQSIGFTVVPQGRWWLDE